VTTWLAALAAAGAVVLAISPRARWPTGAERPPVASTDDRGWMRRWRWVWSLLSGLAGATFVSGTWGLPVGVATCVATWVWIGRTEPASVRRRRQAAERELPALVHLLATALESGCDVGDGLRLVCDALPGPAAHLLGSVPARLALGVPPEAAWLPILDDPQLAPLGRAMVRAHRSGSSVTDEVARLADELDRLTHTRVEERARAVGVKAAVPLGLCLLPSFLLIGVVPLVAGLLRSLSL
jgi:hypothetical protein